jgi:hypothetical protein
MATKERYQNPTIGDNLRLRMLTFNNNVYKNVHSIQKVEIYQLDNEDPTDVSKRRLVETIDGANVTQDSTGQYSILLELVDPLYCIGQYTDIWFMAFERYEEEECEIAPVEQYFEVVRDLWFTAPVPIVYDFSFTFQPNRIRHGSKQHLLVNVAPNVPRACDLQSYYLNLVVVSPLYISIAQRCGDCVPQEEDLRLVVDRKLVEFREKTLGYYFIDTTEWELGIYDVWFELDVAESVYVSPKSQLQIF